MVFMIEQKKDNRCLEPREKQLVVGLVDTTCTCSMELTNGNKRDCAKMDDWRVDTVSDFTKRRLKKKTVFSQMLVKLTMVR